MPTDEPRPLSDEEIGIAQHMMVDVGVDPTRDTAQSLFATIADLKSQLAVSRELRAQDHRREIAMNGAIVAVRAHKNHTTRNRVDVRQGLSDALAELDNE